jgi:hypothetical protein
MRKLISYLYNFFFRRKNTNNLVIDVSINHYDLNNQLSHVDIVQYLIKKYFINQSKYTFTSADIFKVIRSNREDDILIGLTVQQLRRALYKLRLKNAIYKQQIVLDSQKESKYNVYCINPKYDWL